MSYVVAGYTICLSVLFLYAVGLILRRRRLTRAVAVAERDQQPLDGVTATHSPATGDAPGRVGFR